jgi:glucose-1-phosphate thymidylyltransferase
VGSRLGNLPFSKELMPVRTISFACGGGAVESAIENAIKVLVENDITQQHIVIRPDKSDIPEFLADGSHLHAQISYVVVGASPSVPHSVDAAFALVREREVVLIFPDIVFRPRNAISNIVALRSELDADAALALVPSKRGDKADIVTIDDSANVLSVRPKPGSDVEGWTWIAAVWSDRFTEFLHNFLRDQYASSTETSDRELFVADILNAAIDEGLSVCAAEFPHGDATDIGTVEDLVQIWMRRD